MPPMAKKLLITGGCGFIGVNAAIYFAKKGWNVHCVDNFSRTGSRLNADVLRADAPAVQIDELNVVTDAEKLASLIGAGDFDVILHAAAQVAVTSSVTDPMHDFSTNALGTLNVLNATRSLAKKPVVLFTSTNKVYGELEHVQLEEGATRYSIPALPLGVPETTPLDFHSPYGCSKGTADQYTRDWSRIYDVPTIVFRQSCIYGEHQFGIVDQGWVVFLTMKALFGKPITIYGDGKQVRDVLFMDDLSAAFDAAIASIEKTRGQIYNIGGSPQYSLSILEFVQFVEKRLGKKIEVQFAEARPGDQKVYISDVRKAATDFGWKPTTSFEEGFEKIRTWIESNRATLEPLL